MGKIQLVIEIEERLYKNIMDNDKDDEEFEAMDMAFCNAKPLPKGHGRIGDLDALETEMVNGIHAGNYEEGYETFAHINNMDDCVDCVRCADTIIEADKEDGDG